LVLNSLRITTSFLKGKPGILNRFNLPIEQTPIKIDTLQIDTENLFLLCKPCTYFSLLRYTFILIYVYILFIFCKINQFLRVGLWVNPVFLIYKDNLLIWDLRGLFLRTKVY